MSEHDHKWNAALSNRVKALVDRLEQRGIITDKCVDETIENFLEHAKPANGFRIVARAWKDAAFKSRLLADANAAIAELGIDMRHWSPVKLRVVENTDREHNLIVCTLCSCYPIALLGPSPRWYKSVAYRSQAVRDPHGFLAAFGITLPPDVRINVWDSTSELRYFVLPQRPVQSKGMTEDQLAEIITRDALIGIPLRPDNI